MFVPNFKDSIPGYTGHKRHELDTGAGPDLQQAKDARKQIPGYGGYITGIKSENVFGETYGKTSFASSAKTFNRGMDEPSHLKYESIMKKEFTDHAEKTGKIETTAQIVGVVRGEDMYKKPVPPSQKHAFYGADLPSNTIAEQTGNLQAQAAYREALAESLKVVAVPQDEASANAAFFGVDCVPAAKTVKPLGEPIPGYSGVNRRVQADNVFGMTYAEARKMAGESLAKIDAEKSETLKETSKWVPEHQR